jgi:PleD family two-component response regulator
VAEAKTAEEALSLYSQLHPDLLLLDAIMPDMDGFVCCQRLQLLPNGDKTPVIMMIDDAAPAMIDRAFAVGASDYVHKPIQWSVLGRRIQRILVGRSEYQGTGIGLAICRKIVERHQGEITAHSHPGHGAKFIVTLPLENVS